MGKTVKRRKPWYRPRNIVLFLLAVFVVWVGSWVYWALTVEPNPTIDYAAELEQLSAAAQPEGENAWPHLKAAMATLNRLDMAFPIESRPIEHAQGHDATVLDDPDPSPEAVAWLREVDAWIEDEGIWEHLADAARCPRMVRPLQTNGGMLMTSLLGDLASTRRLARWRMTSMRLALENGSENDALDALEQTMALGRLYTWQATMIDMLVGRAIVARARAELTYALMEQDLDPRALRRIIDLLDEDGRLGPVSLQLEGERRFLLDIVQRVYSDDGNGSGYVLPAFAERLEPALTTSRSPADPSGLRRLSNLFGPFFPSRREIVDRMNNLYDVLADMAATPFPARGVADAELQQCLLKLGSRFEIVSVPAPALVRSIDQSVITTCSLRGARLLAAIELYRADRGNYPASLDDLLPSCLPELPHDPVSGLPFVYRLVDDDRHGRHFLLYSVGVDGTDDGGRKGLHDNGLALIRDQDVDVEGIDFIVNLPREVAGSD